MLRIRTIAVMAFLFSAATAQAQVANTGPVTVTKLVVANMPSWFYFYISPATTCDGGVMALTAEMNKAAYSLVLAALLAQKQVVLYYSTVRSDRLCELVNIDISR
jgi:hypothetical protein